jgi:hypothetical protein
MNHTLIELLSSSWKGRQALQSSLEGRGFEVPGEWRQKIVDMCGEDAGTLQRYWDEVATEAFCCAGKVNSEARKFIVEPGYRSSFLDELAAKVDFAEPPYRYPPLVRCLYEYIRRARRDRSFLDDETAYLETVKQREIERFSLSAEGLAGRKRDLVPVVAKLTALRGFNQRRNSFIKKTAGDVIFQIYVDVGGIPELGFGLPLHCSIYHMSDPEFVYQATSFDRIVPGFFKYEYCPTPESCVLGILVHVEMFEILFRLLSGATCTSAAPR